MKKIFELKNQYSSVIDIINGQEGQSVIEELKKGEIEFYAIKSSLGNLYCFDELFSTLQNVITEQPNIFFIPKEDSESVSMETFEPTQNYQELYEKSKLIINELQLKLSEYIKDYESKIEKLETITKDLCNTIDQQNNELEVKTNDVAILEKKLIAAMEKTTTYNDVVKFILDNKGFELKIKNVESNIE